MINLDTVIQLGFVGVAAFGTVGAITLYKTNLTSVQKFLLLAGFAFVYGFVPADLGNSILNRIKDAVAVATSLTAAYTAVKAVGK